ncbi:MAG TPA: response regulator transcription factor, partial [Acidimicrobiia bacterium]|nr:response regulator transcription factor [Acidimicrobiia bacterium]
MMDNFGNESSDVASNATIPHQDAVLKELGGGVGDMADAVDKDPNYWVLSIDDDPFLRLGLDSALSQTKDIEFSSAASKADGMQVFVEMWNGSREDMKRKPSLILLDQDLQGGEKGTDLLSEIIDFCGG